MIGGNSPLTNLSSSTSYSWRKDLTSRIISCAEKVVDTVRSIFAIFYQIASSCINFLTGRCKTTSSSLSVHPETSVCPRQVSSSNGVQQTVPYPLQAALQDTDVTVLLKCLIPEYDPNNQAMKTQINRWLGFPNDYNLTRKDLETVQQKMLYADLRPEQQRIARQTLYTNLKLLLTENKWITLPFKDPKGYTIKIRLIQNPLTQEYNIELFHYHDDISKVGTEGYTIAIGSNGDFTYCLYDLQKYAICPDQLTQKYTASVKNQNITDKLIKTDTNDRIDTIRYWFQQNSHSCLELIIQNYQTVHNFLSKDPSEKKNHALKLFHGCLALLQSFAEKQHPLQVQALKDSNQKAKDSSTTTYGPLWNPVTNASDSVFTWSVTEDNDTGYISFSSQKRSGGRIFSSSSTRSVTFVTTNAKDNFKVVITRGESWDIGASSTKSEYLCKLNKAGLPVIQEINREHSFEELSLFLELPDTHVSDNFQPTLKEQQADAQFVSEVLENIVELSSSPHTILLSSWKDKETPCFTLQGDSIPDDRLAHFAIRCINSQGGITHDARWQNWQKIDPLIKKQQTDLALSFDQKDSGADNSLL